MSAKQTKKTTTKKPTKPTKVGSAAPKAKAKATTKKPTAKAKPKATPKAKTPQKKAMPKVKPHSLTASRGTKRPPNNPNVPQQLIDTLNGMFNQIKIELENYAAHLRALDRKRLNDVGIKRQGFIERAHSYAIENPEFLPHYLTLDKFREDNDYFTSFRNLFDLSEQLQEILWNITIQSADIVYTDALEFYASVREAAKRRVDAAETIFKNLEVFFKHKKASASEEIVEREVIRS